MAGCLYEYLKDLYRPVNGQPEVVRFQKTLWTAQTAAFVQVFEDILRLSCY